MFSTCIDVCFGDLFNSLFEFFFGYNSFNRRKLRKDSLKSSFKTSGILQVDLHVKPGIKGSHAKNRLLVDLVGPPGSGESDGTVDEMRVGVYYDDSTRELWHMEYIGVEYGNSWLEHPWECRWKYPLKYAAAGP